MTFAESGNGLPFDKDNVRDFRDAMASTDEFDKYMWHLDYKITRMENMDW